MRSKRACLAGLGILFLLPSALMAQEGRDFQDSWFWGVKAGGVTYGTVGASGVTSVNGAAPMVGFDWLITRSEAGLYVSASQAFLSQQTAIANGPSAADTGYRTVDIKNMRRVDVALMAFPGTHAQFHPYVGVGFSLNDVGSASPEGPFNTTDEITYAQQTVQNLKAEIAPLLIVGGQYRLRKMSAFGQVAVTATNQNFLLYNGNASISLEFGVRYNIGSSISDDK